MCVYVCRHGYYLSTVVLLWPHSLWSSDRVTNLNHQANMSVVGFDFGNESCVVAVARQRGIDVVLNDESKRETPSLVCFGDKQRFLGTAGAASSLMNPKNTISQIKRLIGRQFSDPELQRDLKSLPFLVTEGPDGYPLIHARIAEKNLSATAVVDCCIGIPAYFTDLQRRAVIDAATIAGLHPLRLIHETTATALAYGIYKTDLPENEPMNVAFVDAGHASLQVCIAAFKKGQLKILAHSFDRSLGGRDFDEALFQHFAAKFKDEYKIDVYQNAKACLRLRAGCEKLKKVLSANPEAPLNIECLVDDKDVRGFIKREEFEQISTSVLEHVKKPLEKALADAGLTIQNIHSVEVVNESFPFPIALTWKAPAGDTQNGAGGDNLQSTIVFPNGNPIPSMKASTFYRSETFTLDVQYSDVSELQAPAKISHYIIGPFQSANGEKAKLKVKVRLNLHGVVSVESATLLEEEEVEVPVVKESDKEPAKMETDELPADPAPPSAADVNMQDSTTEVPAAEKWCARASKLVDFHSRCLYLSWTTSNITVLMLIRWRPPKKKVNKKTVPVSEVVFGALAAPDVQKAVEKESRWLCRIVSWRELTKTRRMLLRSYVYDMRNKLHDKYHDFATELEREQLIARLQEVEDWLYEDGEDETKGVYVAKLEELKKLSKTLQQGDPIEERYKEHTERGSEIDQIAYCINSYREAAMSIDPKFDHIDVAEKQKVLNECVGAEAWLREKKQQQDSLPKHANPVLLSADVKKKAEALDRFCWPIMTKPKPAKPATPEPTSPAPSQGSESQPQGAGSSPGQNTEAGAGQEVPPAAAEPMERDKPEGSQNV
ncbi:hypothetical protein SASPL_120479 [Salvia splendens]|uniref:Heat shock 70kDa protein 4 n=1 Tax=Salvia splendens TaxID=180675 RepID=A0A8X8XUN9_SALSN|nr:hypothetical protein SASPL_120479 [Salvia splendens]